MDIFSCESARRIRDKSVLLKVDAFLDWSAISVLLKNGLKRSGLGPQGYRVTGLQGDYLFQVPSDWAVA